MKHFLLLPFALCISLIGKSQDTIISIAYSSTAWQDFYFEDSSDVTYFSIDTLQSENIWQIGAPNKFFFDSAHSQPNALVTDTILSYPANNVSSFTFTIFSDDDTFIQFWQKFDTDTLQDGLVIEVSEDGGDTWVNAVDHPSIILSQDLYSMASPIVSAGAQIGFSGNSNGWVNSLIRNHVSCYYMRFRFTFYSDSTNTSKDGWMIDDITVNCLGTGIENIADKDLIIYPNPSSDIVFIKSKNHESNVVIKNLFGQIVKTVVDDKVDMSELECGLYIIECNSQGKKSVTKLIKN
jgi:hypothetical protein